MLWSRVFLKLHPTQLKTTCTGKKSTLRSFSRTSGLANNWIAIAAVAWPSMGIGMNGKLVSGRLVAEKATISVLLLQNNANLLVQAMESSNGYGAF